MSIVPQYSQDLAALSTFTPEIHPTKTDDSSLENELPQSWMFASPHGRDGMLPPGKGLGRRKRVYEECVFSFLTTANASREAVSCTPQLKTNLSDVKVAFPP